MRLETLDKLSQFRLLRPLLGDPDIFDRLFKICLVVLLVVFVGFYCYSINNQRYSFLRYEKTLYILDTRTADLYLTPWEIAVSEKKPRWLNVNPFRAKVYEIPTDSLAAIDKTQ
jgi:hypothetical protein